MALDVCNTKQFWLCAGVLQRNSAYMTQMAFFEEVWIDRNLVRRTEVKKSSLQCVTLIRECTISSTHSCTNHFGGKQCFYIILLTGLESQVKVLCTEQHRFYYSSLWDVFSSNYLTFAMPNPFFKIMSLKWYSQKKNEKPHNFLSFRDISLRYSPPVKCAAACHHQIFHFRTISHFLLYFSWKAEADLLH